MRIPVEQTVNSFVEHFGGELVKNRMPIANPPDQADYLFHNPLVVGELKCLEKDVFSSDYRQKLNSLVKQWANQGLIRIFGTPALDLRSLPEQCQHGWLDLVHAPLQKIIKSANRQIRETKLYLKLPSAKGLLLLVNEGNTDLTPENVAFFLHRILSRKKDNGQPMFSSIDWFARFSVNLTIEHQAVNGRSYFWLPGFRQKQDPEAVAFLGRLHRGWTEFHGNLLGRPIKQIQLRNSPLGLTTA